VNRYNNIQQIRNRNEFVGTLGDLYYRTVYYPEVQPSENDIYVETDFGDRLDSLAHQFYKDVTLYWIISLANPNKISFGSITIPEGTQLAIPTDISGILDSYNRLNEL
jgi:hypothetical protein|tara:strand:- start:1609 stop:1932 length:324 start_codon:yes stop_codon:yes gene_type:complete